MYNLISSKYNTFKEKLLTFLTSLPKRTKMLKILLQLMTLSFMALLIPTCKKIYFSNQHSYNNETYIQPSCMKLQLHSSLRTSWNTTYWVIFWFVYHSKFTCNLLQITIVLSLTWKFPILPSSVAMPSRRPPWKTTRVRGGTHKHSKIQRSIYAKTRCYNFYFWHQNTFRWSAIIQ
jgi:hypothetical protein